MLYESIALPAELLRQLPIFSCADIRGYLTQPLPRRPMKCCFAYREHPIRRLPPRLPHRKSFGFCGLLSPPLLCSSPQAPLLCGLRVRNQFLRIRPPRQGFVSLLFSCLHRLFLSPSFLPLFLLFPRSR